MASSQKTQILDDWKNLYEPLESGFYLPPTDPFAGNPTTVVVREMIVDMEELNTNLENKASDWTSLEVYADVLVFPLKSDDYPDGFAFKLGRRANQKARFFARSVILADGSGLFVNYNEQTQLSIYTAEVTGGDLCFSGVKGDPEMQTTLSLREGAIGFTIGGSDDCCQPATVLPEGMAALGSPAYWLLESSFNVGSALAHKDSALASRILSWVSVTASFGAAVELQRLSMNAGNLQGYVNQLQSSIAFVPPLNANVYDDVTSLYLASASEFEKTFDATVAELDQLQNVDSFVNANAQYFTDQTGVTQQLVEQMQQNVADAEALLTQNSDKVNGLVGFDSSVEQARQNFSDGVEKYKQEQTDKAIIGVLKAVVEVGACVGAMAFGQEEAAAPAAAAVAEVADAGEAAAETVSALQNLVDAMKKIADVVKELSALISKLKDAYDAVEKLVSASSLQTSDFGADIQVPDDSAQDIFDSAYWDAFSINFEAIMTPYTTGDTKIDGATEYVQQLQYLVVYGKAMYANQVTATQLRQQLFKLVLDETVAENQEARLQDLVTQEAAQEELLQRAKILTYQQLLNVKGKLVFYMNEEASALRYWACNKTLADGGQPSLSDSVGVLNEKLAEIHRNRLHAMESFSPPPQTMNVALAMEQPDLIRQMQQSGRLSWTVSLDNDAFNGFGRVRVDRFRVYVNQEAITSRDDTITFKVDTSAHYYDHYHGGEGQVLEYITTPFKNPIRFEYKASDPNKPIADGNIAGGPDNFSYFEPTPFTTWTIKITEPSPVDLAKIKQVTLELHGSWCSE